MSSSSANSQVVAQSQSQAQAQTQVQSISVATSTSHVRGPLTLPLLEGLSHRPETATAIVEEALKTCQAATRISEWLCKTLKVAGVVPSAVQATTVPVAVVPYHWLFHSLQSPSARERQVACRILCTGCPMDSHSLWQVSQVLCALIDRGHNLVALLKHILLHCRLAVAFLANQHRGLSWLCGLLRKHAQPNEHDETLVASLVDLLYHLVLIGDSDESLQQAQTVLWNDSESLAALITTLHRWKQRKHSLTPPQRDVVHVLKQITDPQSVPTKLRTPSHHPASAKADRLIDTFDRPTPTPTTPNTTARTSSTVRPTEPNSDEDEEFDEEHHSEAEAEEDDVQHDEEDDEEHDDHQSDDEEMEEQSFEEANNNEEPNPEQPPPPPEQQQQQQQQHKKENDDDDDDEEIDSDEEDCEFDNEDEDEGEHDIVIPEHEDDEEDDEMPGFRQGILDLQEADEEERHHLPQVQAHTTQIERRKHSYVEACMKVLAMQHISIQSESDLINDVLNIVRPPKKPINSKIILRRAPTQEDFFRGALSKNPVSLQMLRKDGNTEPTVRDLRQLIADDLQMSDSAELLELLVANKILDIELKLRVVHQVLWKRYLMQNSNGPSAASALSSLLGGSRSVARSIISSRSGLSMFFATGALSGLGPGLGSSSDTNGNAITDDTPLAALPPMVVTYRLTGVDGEATEDTVATLDDPDAPSETSDPEQREKLLEKEYGITRAITVGRGVYWLLKSVERNVNDTLRKIRRDDIGTGDNLSRHHFKTCSPFPGLTLLSTCAKLASNRKLLLLSRAPTILLRLLLDVLHALEDDGLSESNPTAKLLQELIEILASDMLSSIGTTVTDVDREDTEQDTSTLRLLLSAIETSSLSRPLRNVIAKLLPYLTYGQATLSTELALEFVRHVDVNRLGEYEQESEGFSHVLIATFVHASTCLPANDVCNTLRIELLRCGFIERIAAFILENCPSEPPSWSPALWPKGDLLNAKKKGQLEKQWKNYTQRPGLKPAFEMLIGLSKQHEPTRSFIGNFQTNQELLFSNVCHWIESTSDNTSARISIKALGLLAETLLDELASEGSSVATQVKATRTNTRNRKKEIAMERRSKALVSMNMGAFGGANKTATKTGMEESGSSNSRGTATSLLAPVLGLFQNSESISSETQPAKRRKTSASPKGKDDEQPSKPAWMTEMENIEDETGLTCAVCQEGRTLQPSELLGLYAYVKKVSVPLSQCGGRTHIDGTTLLTCLPTSLPASLSDSHAALEWFPAARCAGEDLKDSARSSLSSIASSRRAACFTTTVTAGNAIHFSCHNRARQADRNHPKAPKSEWEGASLRNSRVNCNVIMPLVNSRSSKVPLVAVDVALTEHQTAISNLLGARPKSMLWNILHDVRFLVLRMAYGEPLNADCGGGSLASNAQFVFHQLLMADMFEKDAQVDAPEMAQHARNLSAGFLVASAITHADDFNSRSNSQLCRGLADSSTMSCLTCILFHNTKDDYSSSVASATTESEEAKPHPKRRWVIGRDYFLRGLLNCAGRRHALGVEGSGCSVSRNTANKRRRPAGFADWDIVDEDEMMELSGSNNSASASAFASGLGRSGMNSASIDDFRDALRPMIVYFAIMDQLSNDFVLSLDDVQVNEFANRLVEVIGDCHSCKSIHELLRKARVNLDNDEIMEELQKGMMAA